MDYPREKGAAIVASVLLLVALLLGVALAWIERNGPSGPSTE